MVGSWEQKDAIRDRKSPPTHPLLLVALCCRLDLGGLSAVGPYPLLSSPKDPLDDGNDDGDDDDDNDDDDDDGDEGVQRSIQLLWCIWRGR